MGYESKGKHRWAKQNIWVLADQHRKWQLGRFTSPLGPGKERLLSKLIDSAHRGAATFRLLLDLLTLSLSALAPVEASV